MRWCVLGPVEVSVDRRRTAVASDRQRTIVAALLAAGGEVVSTDRLIDGLWGPRPPPSAPKTLQSHVSKLRRSLAALEAAGDEVVVTAADGYRVDLTACEVDAVRFEELVSQARDLTAEEPQAAVALLEEADGLWRGPAFGELAAHTLVQAEARRLEQLRAAAVAARIDTLLASGRHREVVGELEARADRDPLDERAHGQLMVALYRDGHQAAALATYRRLRDRLGEEVGIDPSDDLQRLHERILRQDADLVPAAARPDSTRPSAASGDAAAPVGVRGHPARADLIGRDEDLPAVVDLVGATALVTLIGTGGVGKTRLAEQVAVAAAETFPDGVVVCPLASVRDPDSVASAVIDAVGARHPGGRPAEETLVAALGTRRLLLVLDNCEHLLGAVSPLVETIIAACPNLAVLATSREPLRLPGERVWQVAPLAVPPARASAAEVTAAPAGTLFVTRARAAEPSFALTDDNAATVGELCRRLDGIPLALELAAARVRAMPPGDLLERIDQRFSLLTGGPHREQGRHRTLHAVVGWSYDALSEAEARLFDRLSVFAAPFILAAAEDVCVGEPLTRAGVAGVLAELVDRSMVTVERDGGGTRYRLLDTLRDYGAARLAETGEAARYRQAHAAYHVAFAETHGPRIRGEDERNAVARIDLAVDDLRVAHAWLVEAGDVDGALRLPVALRDYIGHRQRDEMVTWVERALELPGAPEHAAYPAALATCARGAARRGDLDQGRRYAEATLERAEPTSLAATWATHALATVALYEGRLDDVLTLTAQRTPLADAAGEDYYRAMNTMLRVLAHQYRGDTQAAADQADELRAAAEASGNDAMRAWALYCQGEARLETDPAAAAPLLEAAIEVARRAETRVPEGVAMVSLASLSGRNGEVARAVELFAEVVAHWRRLGDWTHQLTTLRNLVELLVHLGADEPAAVLHAAVSDASPPSFGAESARLAAAWGELERRLGPERAAAAAERGRRLGPAETVDETLVTLDGLRAS